MNLTTPILAEAHNKTFAQGAAILEVYKVAGISALEPVAERTRAGMSLLGALVVTALAHRARVAALKKQARASEQDLKMVVAGTYAIVQATAPTLYAQLPERTIWAGASPGEQAMALETALRDAGGAGLAHADALAQVAQRRENDFHAWIQAGSTANAVLDGANAVAEMRVIVAQADLALRPYAKPGTPLFELLKKARTAGRKPSKKKVTEEVPPDASKKEADEKPANTEPVAPPAAEALGTAPLNAANTSAGTPAETAAGA